MNVFTKYPHPRKRKFAIGGSIPAADIVNTGGQYNQEIDPALLQQLLPMMEQQSSVPVPEEQLSGIDAVRNIDSGGTHEENPIEGVPMGYDNEGVQNLVEEGEVIYKDYVFSNRINIDSDMIEPFNLRNGLAGLTYADAARKLQDESSERPNDIISQRGLDAAMNNLMAAQETQKLRSELSKKKLNSESELSKLAETGNYDESLEANDAVLADELGKINSNPREYIEELSAQQEQPMPAMNSEQPQIPGETQTPDVISQDAAMQDPTSLGLSYGGNLKEHFRKYANGGNIKINPDNKGKFTQSARRAGMGIQEYASHILSHKEKYSPTLIRRAVFARNAKKFDHSNNSGNKYQDGGNLWPDYSWDDAKKHWRQKAKYAKPEDIEMIVDVLNDERYKNFLHDQQKKAIAQLAFAETSLCNLGDKESGRIGPFQISRAIVPERYRKNAEQIFRFSLDRMLGLLSDYELTDDEKAELKKNNPWSARHIKANREGFDKAEYMPEWFKRAYTPEQAIFLLVAGHQRPHSLATEKVGDDKYRYANPSNVDDRGIRQVAMYVTNNGDYYHDNSGIPRNDPYITHKLQEDFDTAKYDTFYDELFPYPLYVGDATKDSINASKYRDLYTPINAPDIDTEILQPLQPPIQMKAEYHDVVPPLDIEDRIVAASDGTYVVPPVINPYYYNYMITPNENLESSGRRQGYASGGTFGNKTFGDMFTAVNKDIATEGPKLMSAFSGGKTGASTSAATSSTPTNTSSTPTNIGTTSLKSDAVANFNNASNNYSKSASNIVNSVSSYYKALGGPLTNGSTNYNTSSNNNKFDDGGPYDIDNAHKRAIQIYLGDLQNRKLHEDQLAQYYADGMRPMPEKDRKFERQLRRDKRDFIKEYGMKNYTDMSPEEFNKWKDINNRQFQSYDNQMALYRKGWKNKLRGMSNVSYEYDPNIYDEELVDDQLELVDTPVQAETDANRSSFFKRLTGAAPSILNGMQAANVIGNLFRSRRPADYSTANMIKNAANAQMGYSQAGFSPVTTRVRARSIDPWHIMNNQIALGNANRVALQGLYKGNRGAMANALLTNNYNTQRNLSDAAIKGAEENAALQAQAAQINQATEQANAQLGASVSAQNASIRQNALSKYADMMNRAANQYYRLDSDKQDERNAALASYNSMLGDFADSLRNYNRGKTSADLDYYEDLNGNIHYRQ